MPLPSALTRASRILGEAILDTVLGAPPAAADLARRLDDAVDWAALPVGVRGVVEKLDGPLWEVVAEAVIEGVEWVRPELMRRIAVAQGQTPRA
jgi:hypothetical protein